LSDSNVVGCVDEFVIRPAGLLLILMLGWSFSCQAIFRLC